MGSVPSVCMHMCVGVCASLDQVAGESHHILEPHFTCQTPVLMGISQSRCGPLT